MPPFALKRRYFYDWKRSACTLLAKYKRDLAAGNLVGEYYANY